MKKGFTLIELLAVIVILAVILIIAVPQINKVIADTTKKAFESDAKIVLSQLDYKLIDGSVSIESINESNIESVLGIKSTNYESILVNNVDGSPYVLIVGKNKWDGLIIYGDYGNVTLTTDNSNYNQIYEEKIMHNYIDGVNRPKLAKGMTPVKWDGSSWITTTETDENWYNYVNKNWANAKTADGSMWVWIPRYVYRISSGWHSNTAGTIDVKFSIGTDDTIGGTVTLDTGTTSNASNNKWTNHPAFTFGSTQLTGIWVAKFEPTASEGLANTYTADYSCASALDNVTTKTIKVIPNVASWRCITVGNAFTTIRNMETKSAYGWDTASTLKADGTFTTDTNNLDTHLMKNVEWGAATYLSKSIYGKNTEEVWMNNDINCTTGCAGNNVYQAENNGCLNTYNSTNGVKASTTGTIYGIYDMSGGSYERVSAYIDNSTTNLNTNGASIVSANGKYKDVYSVGTTDAQTDNYTAAINKKGEAIYETSNNINGSYSWYTDEAFMLNTTSPFLHRGNYYHTGVNSGLFSFRSTSGSILNNYGFRPVLIVGTGL